MADALAGLRANEARYFKNKYDHVFTVEPAERGQGDGRLGAPHPRRRSATSSSPSPPLEATEFQVEDIRMAYVFYESGLSINVMYTSTTRGSGRSGSSSPTGWRSPTELAERFKFARQKSKLAGTIRGSYFVIKNEY